jgi:hemolysin III
MTEPTAPPSGDAVVESPKKSTRHRPQTIGEEIANAITHGIGALFSVFALVFLVAEAAYFRRGPVVVASMVIYGISLIVLYLSSTLYHALTNKTAKFVFKILDHSGIYLLIAGSYTPFCLVALANPLGYAIFAAEWTLAIAGISTEAFWVHRPKWANAVIYIAMGWLAIVALPDLLRALGPTGAWLLAGGGIAYTLGAVFYVVKTRFMHMVWHLFVLLGSVLHFLAVALFVVPPR